MTLLRRTFAALAWLLFIAGELHACWVLRPWSNLDHAWMVFGNDSIVPYQFRLASYRAGAGALGDPGFLIPASFGVALAGYLVLRRASKKPPRTSSPKSGANLMPWPDLLALGTRHHHLIGKRMTSRPCSRRNWTQTYSASARRVLASVTLDRIHLSAIVPKVHWLATESVKPVCRRTSRDSMAMDSPSELEALSNRRRKSDFRRKGTHHI